jgi:hypothetical protein
LAADNTNTRIEALMMCGRAATCFIATTKGDAAAELLALVAKIRSGEL